ncbi:Uncharacterized protein DAT39_003139, partial [Clarias magur]
VAAALVGYSQESLMDSPSQGEAATPGLKHSTGTIRALLHLHTDEPQRRQIIQHDLARADLFFT